MKNIPRDRWNTFRGFANRVGTFPNGTDLNLSRVLASVPNRDGDVCEEETRTWSPLLLPRMIFSLLPLLLLLLLPSFTYYFGSTLFCSRLSYFSLIHRARWVIRGRREMVDLAANLNKYGHARPKERWTKGRELGSASETSLRNAWVRTSRCGKFISFSHYRHLFDFLFFNPILQSAS